MLTILITGASGNVGIEVIKSLQKLTMPLNVVAGVRDIETDSKKLAFAKIKLVEFDITNPSTSKNAFNNCDIIFLLRPPQISDVQKYFEPLINGAVKAKSKHIVFLSVQGVEKSKIIPHHKIEKLIVESKIPYTFLRPAYFMQNFTTTLRNDLIHKKRIFLPAGNSKFTLVDVNDIGKVTAKILSNTESHINQAYELTSTVKYSFQQIAEKLTVGLGTKIEYTSPSLLKFFLTKRKERIPVMLILVMIMLHYFPRFQKEPMITDWIKKITGDEPISFEQFISTNKALLI
jgi:uncharacterized protein YbjT (DUF2867 family)